MLSFEKSKFVIFVGLSFDLAPLTESRYCTIVCILRCDLSIPCLTHLSLAHGRRNVWNIVGARCRVGDSTMLMALWGGDSKISKTT